MLLRITTIAEVRDWVAQVRAAGQSLGFVPTMGALHAGHLSLVQASLSDCDQTIVSIFVNPHQFGPQEDYLSYPRDTSTDLDALAELGVPAVFTPDASEMFPPGFSTHVEPPGVARRWEGACRPRHFRGVATVVLKLLNLIPAERVFFGLKDYQQCLVVESIVRDLNLPITIRRCPIVREDGGLALSSRNRYLNDDQRRAAASLSQSLELAARLVAQGERCAAAVASAMRQVLLSAGVERIDYVALADPETLEPVDQFDRPVQALVAAYVGQTRLIDNAPIGNVECGVRNAE